MEVITIIVILFTWLVLTFLPDYEKEFENVMSPNQIESGKSILHTIFTMPLLTVGMMFLLEHFFDDGGIIFIFSAHILILILVFVSSIYWRGQYKAARKESLVKAQQFFNKFPWDQLEHAYGIATDTPEYLSALIDEKDAKLDAREDAVNDFLYARPWHQYSVYSSTPYAIKCVHYIIKNVDISRLKIGKNPLLFDLIHFIYLCIHGAKNDEKLKITIIEGKEIYKQLQNHPNAEVQKIAIKLNKFCLQTEIKT